MLLQRSKQCRVHVLFIRESKEHQAIRAVLYS